LAAAVSAISLETALSQFGQDAKAKLCNPSASGEAEDQLRAPLEALIQQLAALTGVPKGAVTTIGESSLADLKTRPDYAVTVNKALVGFVEVKAPGKGADPRRFKDAHDKAQWAKLQTLPNLIYTDGNGFTLWQDGQLARKVDLDGDVETSGAALTASGDLISLFADFLQWQPMPPKTAKQLADTSALLCRLLREEVAEQLERGAPALTSLAADWRKLLFPDATNDDFADGYAQAVTFGLLMARSQSIPLTGGLDRVAKQLRKSNSLIGTALRLLTDDADGQEALKTSLRTLARVLDAVDWPTVGKGDPEAWLYFYEEFLAAYDNKLRKRTGSYYTPPPVVRTMIRLVDEALRSPARFDRPRGLAAKDVTLADPAVGTGTFLLGALRTIAETIEADLGAGAVPGAIEDALERIIGFEKQFGPFAVAQLRLLAEIADLTGKKGGAFGKLRLFMTDTLANPYAEQEWIPQMLAPLAEQRRQANTIKSEEPITVVIGNPPYKEKAKGWGGWIEEGSENSKAAAPLQAWMPPPEWGVGAHAKHLRNLYVYFWRWATWKVFEDGAPTTERPRDRRGIVCFITVAGFLNGPGFQKMRAELRRDADEIWIVDCSPEGHQPPVATRIFQGVQHPVCIVVAVKTTDKPSVSARVRYVCLPEGQRDEKFYALQQINLAQTGWEDCPSGEQEPFFPMSKGIWSHFTPIHDFFVEDSAGVLPGRTWVISPDEQTLSWRWRQLVNENDPEKKETLFHPTLRNGEPADRHTHKAVREGLAGHEFRHEAVARDTKSVIKPVR